MHILIVGPRQVGKSTLIKKVLNSTSRPVWGFVTKKEARDSDQDPGNPIHIYPAQGPFERTKHNLVGYCKEHHPIVFTEIFDAFAKELPTPTGKKSIILMDELGFMESEAEHFCASVLSCLDGEIPVIAAVKNRSTAFLDKVKNHPNCKCFFITEENRDSLADEVIAFLKDQIEN